MRSRSLHTAALGAAIAILAFVAPVARAGAAPTSACTTAAGVTVIVDFTHFGGSIERGCASGTPVSTLAAIRAAGFTTAGTTRYGEAFLCRIDNLPKPKDEACGETPPANASWSFYYARPTDAAWTFSNTGVLSWKPGPGSLVAFAFGNDAKPGLLPAAALPPPTTAPTTPITASVPTGPPVSAFGAPTTTVAPATSTAAPSTTLPRPTTTRGPSAITTSTRPAPATTTAPHIVDRAASAPSSGDDSGSPLPALIGVALVGALAIGAGLTIRARRRRSA